MLKVFVGEVEIYIAYFSTLLGAGVKAWQMEGSKMFIQEGTTVRLEDLIYGMVVQSGNDASVALAKHGFLNPGKDAEVQYLCDGIAESLINWLSAQDSVKVSSKSASFHAPLGGSV